MTRSARDLHVEARDALFAGRMANLVNRRDWELLREVGRLAEADAPVELAFSDPALYQLYRNSVTQFHLAGWTHMTPARIDAVLAEMALAPPTTNAAAAA